MVPSMALFFMGDTYCLPAQTAVLHLLSGAVVAPLAKPLVCFLQTQAACRAWWTCKSGRSFCLVNKSCAAEPCSLYAVYVTFIMSMLQAGFSPQAVMGHCVTMTPAGQFVELYCQRCPRLQSASDYTLLLVAVSDARRHRSSNLQLLPVSTRDVTPPTFLTAPSVSNIGESNFTLTLSLSEPGEKRLPNLYKIIKLHSPY